MQTLNILWLDDQRDPLKYFDKKDEKGWGTLHDNLEFYTQLRQQYDLNFTWVRNYKEFVNYIETNGVPQFVSFDHDLSKTSLPTDPKGLDCARWLVSYCKQNGIKMPQTYVHSANKKWRGVMRDVLAGIQENRLTITESDILEMVYEVVNIITEGGVYMDKTKFDDKKKTIGLTYNRDNNSNKNNLTSMDYLKTDKMEANNGDTYEVTLKGGLTCYNITSIKGTEVMHYFKRLWDKQDTNIKIKDKDKEENYKLTFEKQQESKFFERFISKIEYVIQSYLKENGTTLDAKNFSGISIYPVPSSSNFNNKMAEKLMPLNIFGLPVQTISPEILKKDLRNLEKDTEFIEKNADFFKGPLSPNKDFSYSVEQSIDNNISKYKALKGSLDQNDNYIDVVEEKVEALNKLYLSMTKRLYNYKDNMNIENLIRDYTEYYQIRISLKASQIQYINAITNKPNTFGSDSDIIKPKKGTKTPSVKKNSQVIWKYIKPYVRGGVKTKDGKIVHLKPIEIQSWEKTLFQIKKLTNGERMGLKNIYNPSTKTDFLKSEVEKTKGTIFLIFDDNVSGGATLSDICYQCKELGIQNIIPITFGQMSEKWTLGKIPLNKPKNNHFNY